MFTYLGPCVFLASSQTFVATPHSCHVGVAVITSFLVSKRHVNTQVIILWNSDIFESSDISDLAVNNMEVPEKANTKVCCSMKLNTNE